MAEERKPQVGEEYTNPAQPGQGVIKQVLYQPPGFKYFTVIGEDGAYHQIFWEDYISAWMEVT